jgi:DNA-binding Lrp family transcriptional regulator
MTKLKLSDFKLLFELMKDSKRSDRQLAKALGMSQPTVTRKRTFLEKEMLDGYTAVPKWEKLGYEILAMTFIKMKVELASKEKYEAIRKKGAEWLMKRHNVVMAGSCRGMGMDAFMISLHESYSDYDDFMRNYKSELGETMNDVQSILVNLCGKEVVKPFHLKYIAEGEPHYPGLGKSP